MFRVQGTGIEEISRIWRVTATNGVELVYQLGTSQTTGTLDTLLLSHTAFILPEDYDSAASESLVLAHTPFVIATDRVAGSRDTLLITHTPFEVRTNRLISVAESLLLQGTAFRVPEYTFPMRPETLLLTHSEFNVPGQHYRDREESLLLSQNEFNILGGARELKVPTNFTATPEDTRATFGPPVLARWTGSESPTAPILVITIPSITTGSPDWRFGFERRLTTTGAEWTAISLFVNTSWGAVSSQVTANDYEYRVRITAAPTNTLFSRNWSNTITVPADIPPQ